MGHPVNVMYHATFESFSARFLDGCRCNVGGGTVCHMSCVLMGYSEGSCGADFNCNCSGTTRWGNVIETVQNRV